MADWGELRQYFSGQTFATQDIFVATTLIQPGKSNHPSHRHAAEEYMILTDGTGTWSLDGKEFPAQRGDVLYAAPGSTTALSTRVTRPPPTWCSGTRAKAFRRWPSRMVGPTNSPARPHKGSK